MTSVIQLDPCNYIINKGEPMGLLTDGLLKYIEKTYDLSDCTDGIIHLEGVDGLSDFLVEGRKITVPFVEDFISTHSVGEVSVNWLGRSVSTLVDLLKCGGQAALSLVELAISVECIRMRYRKSCIFTKDWFTYTGVSMFPSLLGNIVMRNSYTTTLVSTLAIYGLSEVIVAIGRCNFREEKVEAGFKSS